MTVPSTDPLRTDAPWRGLYAIVDPERCSGDPHRLAEAVLRGGASALQLRAKRMEDRERLDLARSMAALARRHGVPFIVDDRVDIALLAGADGVHLGQRDLPLEAARRLAPSLHVGLSTHDARELELALAEGPDLVAFGPLFPTRSKERADPTVGLDGLEAAARRLDGFLPLVAIGGITPTLARAAARRGARMVAVIGALAEADDPERVARGFLEALRGTAAHPGWKRR